MTVIYENEGESCNNLPASASIDVCQENAGFTFSAFVADFSIWGWLGEQHLKY